MVGWILAVLALLFFQTLLPPAIRYAASGRRLGDLIGAALGPRNKPLPMPVAGERAQRALANLFEGLPIFLTLALLSLILGIDDGMASLGAGLFLAARVLYVPCYVFAISGVRSGVWAIGVLGLLVMAAAVLMAPPLAPG
jgi:uncharacterized MAPEG superfamily protein